jgi:hypothetical protein
VGGTVGGTAAGIAEDGKPPLKYRLSKDSAQQ